MSHGLKSKFLPWPKMPRRLGPCPSVWNHVYCCASGSRGSYSTSHFVVSLPYLSLSSLLPVWNALSSDLHTASWFRAQPHCHLLRVACAYSLQPPASLHPLTLLECFRIHQYLKLHSLFVYCLPHPLGEGQNVILLTTISHILEQSWAHRRS